MSEIVLECNGVSKQYSNPSTQVILDHVDLKLKTAETVSIMGASGSGKTTLLHILGGLDTVDKGEINLMGRCWQKMKASDAAIWRNQYLGFIFQFHLLLPEFSALENVAMPLLIRNVNRDEALEKAAICLEQVDLKSHALKTPEKLSGGERQRVAVSRALVGQPRCLLADEPTGNLDKKNAQHVFSYLLNLVSESQTSLVIATHDESLAKQTQRCLNLTEGKLNASH